MTIDFSCFDLLCPHCRSQFYKLSDEEVNKANISFEEFLNEIKEGSFLKGNKERLLFIYKSLLNKGRILYFMKYNEPYFDLNCDFCEHICKFNY